MASHLPTTHYYIPRIEQREPNLFTEEYYSSTDVQIYIDGVEQTEIGYISYAVQEQLKPLYGYASRTFDDMAVGNRIVTGMFKVPIRNPEVQTPLKDILESLNPEDGETNDDYNEKEEGLLDLEDWIDSEDVITDDSYIQDDEVYNYVTKLEALGYDVNESSTMEQILAAIKAFQADNGTLETNGFLSQETKMKIDEKLKNANLESVKIKGGAKLYAGPSNAHGVLIKDGEEVVVPTESVAYVINTLQGWKLVLLEDGTEGYIKDEDIIE